MAPSFSACLLAGGKSTRMGRDKALLPMPGGQLLWQRQLRILEELQPREILWSGEPRPGLPAHLRIVRDLIPHAGPLGGISACLDTLKTDLLVVLAIDLPQMTSAFLRSLLAPCAGSRGAVIRHGDYFEPLAAIYPQILASLAREQLRQHRHTMQEFIHTAVDAGHLTIHPLEEHDQPLFHNANSPADAS